MPCWVKSKSVFFLSAIFFGGSFRFTENAKPLAGKLLRIQPLEPGQALASFRLKQGFRVDQVAVEPMVADPVTKLTFRRLDLQAALEHVFPLRKK